MRDDVTPPDYRDPDWDDHHRVHNWRNYITPDLRLRWSTLPDDLKAILARNADEIASAEEWD